MNIDGLIKTYMEGERECFEFTEYLKHNPVLYPRVGDIFLRELFILANPDRKPPYSRRKKAQMDNLWHKVSKKTLAQYLIGCEIVKNSNLQLDFELENGNKIPFSAYGYLICLFLGRAEELSTQNLQEELIAKLKKEKAQKGICKPDARKYYKTIGLLLDQVASDFPLTKNYCPMKLEYVCKENCPTTLKLGGMELARGRFHYREKEDLLFLYASKKGHLPKELIAGEMLFQFIRKEYSAFLSVPFDQFEMETDWNKEHFNCQLFGVFAYIMDATDPIALRSLPLAEIDCAVVAIGRSMDHSLRAVAALKQLKVENIYARALDSVHKSILEAMNISKIFIPESYAAKLFATKFADNIVEELL